jgi:putative ABC transport system ATP-binding protein
MAIFQRLNRDAGITLILVTHELDIAAYANRAIHFKDGRVVKDERVDRPRLAEEALHGLGAEGG